MSKKIIKAILVIFLITALLFLFIVLIPFLVPKLDSDKSQKIIDIINLIHTPYYYLSFTAFFLLPLGFLPKKEKFESKIDKFYSYLVLFFLFHLSTVFVSQGFTGGCVYTIPQHYLAVKFLSQPDWFILGLAKKEFFEQFVSEKNYQVVNFFLRMAYFIFGLVFVWITARFYVYRISNVKNKKFL